jgi:hypothetical protein
MDMTAVRQQLLKFRSARNNLLFVVAFTTINLFLTAFETGYYFLFSAAVPQVFFEFGRGLVDDYQNKVFLITGSIAAFVGIVVYLVCWSMANRQRVFILVALILFGSDTLLCAFLVFSGEFDPFYLLDIACHIWVLYYLIIGTIAWSKLRDVNSDDLNAAINAMKNKPKSM